MVGLDYILGTPDTSSPYARDRRRAPLVVWGSLLMTAGLIVVAGYVARWRMICDRRPVTQAALMATPWGGMGMARLRSSPRRGPLQAAATGYALQPSYERADGPQ